MLKQIVVEKVTPPAEGKKMGRVYDTEGNFYSDWPDKLAQYIPGNAYELTLEGSEFNGKTYYKVKFRKPLGGAEAEQTKKMSSPLGTHDEGEDMFVRGVMCSCFQGAGDFPEYAELVHMQQVLRSSWKDAKSAGPIPNVKVDIDDEIPFPA